MHDEWRENHQAAALERDDFVVHIQAGKAVQVNIQLKEIMRMDFAQVDAGRQRVKRFIIRAPLPHVACANQHIFLKLLCWMFPCHMPFSLSRYL